MFEGDIYLAFLSGGIPGKEVSGGNTCARAKASCLRAFPFLRLRKREACCGGLRIVSYVAATPPCLFYSPRNWPRGDLRIACNVSSDTASTFPCFLYSSSLFSSPVFLVVSGDSGRVAIF